MPEQESYGRTSPPGPLQKSEGEGWGVRLQEWSSGSPRNSATRKERELSREGRSDEEKKPHELDR